MPQKKCYFGFSPFLGISSIMEGLIGNHSDYRWQIIREIHRLANDQRCEELISKIEEGLERVSDPAIRSRLYLALNALQNPVRHDGYVLIKGKGIFEENAPELSDCRSQVAEPFKRPLSLNPVVDFRIHPQVPDMKLFVDMKRAGVSSGIILATDTDPSDIDKPEISNGLSKQFSSSIQSRWMSFEQLAHHLRSSLHAINQVTDSDIAAWTRDYPDTLFGFGSVNLSKDTFYVEKKLDQISRLGLRGINLSPHAQFFNPSTNENVDLLFQYCRNNGSVVISHTGCGKGPFDLLELSRESNPMLWEPAIRKYPDVPLVLAHCGAYSSFIPGIWLYDALQLAQSHKNVYADFAGVEWILENETIIREIRKTITFDRILFGTDYPLPLASGISMAYLVSSIRANRYLNDKEKRKILGENARRLLRIQ